MTTTQRTIENNVQTRNRTTWLLAAVLVVVIGAIYANVRNFHFIGLDDEMYVTAEPHVRGGLSGENFQWAWGINNKAAMWIPLTWISLQTDASLSGQEPWTTETAKQRLPDAPPPLGVAGVYHVHNVLLQMAAAVMLFLFLQRATKATWAAFGVAALWAVHPLRVESVAWVTERKDVLGGVFGFAAMYAYVAWVERGRWWRYAVSCVALTLSLMAKPMFVSLPIVLVLCDFWPLGRIQNWNNLWKRIVEKWGMIIPAVGVSVTTWIAQELAGVTPMPRSLGERLCQSIISYEMYVVRQIQAWDLGVYYPYHAAKGWELGVVLAAMVAITGVVAWQWRKRPWLLVGWLWFVAATLPMSGIVQAGDQAYADRYSYWPSVGLWVMAVYSIGALKPGVVRRVGVGTVAVAALIFAALSWRQTGYWRDTVTLGERTLAVTGNNWFIRGTLISGYLREGENARAIEQYESVVATDPNFAPARRGLGYLRLETGDVDGAIRDLGRAAQMTPTDAQTRRLYAQALLQAKYWDGAIHEFAAALRFNPGDVQAARGLEIASEMQRAAATQRKPPFR